MKLHISSHVKGMSRFTGIKPLRGFEDSIVKFRIDDSDLLTIKELLSQFNIEDLVDDLASELVECDRQQVALVLGLLSNNNTVISMGLVNAYALRLNVNLSSLDFENIFNVLIQKGILVVQNHHEVIKYELQVQALNSMYGIEA